MLAAALAFSILSACVSVSYQRPGQHITPRSGQTLLLGRLRFFHDGREFFPWNTDLLPAPAGTDTERHVWLLRLTGRAVSAELHPDPDGSLAIWLTAGDYALVGSTEPISEGSIARAVIALLRVPAGPVSAYAGDLLMKTETREGFHVSSAFGVKSVEALPGDTARAALERKLGPLPEQPAVSPWCTGDGLPAFDDSRLAARAKELLDRGCRGAR